MTSESMKAFTDLIREYFRQKADIVSLRAILEGCTRTNAVPNGWEEALKKMRQEPGYQSILQEPEPLFAQLLDAASENDQFRSIEAILRTTRFLN